MHKFCTSIVQYVYSACTETDGVYVRVACVCVCLYLPLQVDISPFSTSTDSILKPCALGILSLHSDRRNETDALEHVTLFGNLHNRLHNVPKGTGLNLKDGVFGVIQDQLGARGVRALNNIFADENNKYTGSKFFRQFSKL